MTSPAASSRARLWKEALYQLDHGSVLWVETTLADFHPLMTAATTSTRFAQRARHMRFTAALYTCVGSRAGDIRYCVRIERLPDFNPMEST